MNEELSASESVAGKRKKSTEDVVSSRHVCACHGIEWGAEQQRGRRMLRQRMGRALADGRATEIEKTAKLGLNSFGGFL